MKGQTENLFLSTVIHVFRPFFHQEREKNDHRTLFDEPNQIKSGNREKADIQGNSVKVAILDLQNIITRQFFEMSA